MLNQNEEILIITTLVLLVLIQVLKRRFYIYSIITLPGTIMHELSHALTSIFFNGQPVDINVIPKRRVEGNHTIYELGYVTSTNLTWYNGWIIGLSPLLLLPIAYYGVYMDIPIIIKIIMIPLLIESSIPSTQDLKVAIKYSYPIPIAMLIIGFLYYNELLILWSNI